MRIIGIARARGLPGRAGHCLRRTLAALGLWLWVGGAPAATPTVLLPDAGIGPANLAVLVNDRDPLSREIADYYRLAHGIPAQNMVHIEFEPGHSTMSAGEFAVLKRVVESRIPEGTQAYLLTWAAPYKVGCMSIGSAFAFGYDQEYCAKGCNNTATNRYALGSSLKPWADFHQRPTMLLAASSFSDAKALIDRGVQARGWYYAKPRQQPAAYLVQTPDKARSVRRMFYPEVAHRFGDQLDVNIVQTEAIENSGDILFYFTGARFVKGIYSNRYLPGAVADHLTSTGGKLTDSRQMSAMEWLRAGATGSYGTVVEPCNIPLKFPNPPRLIEQYLAGRTLLEAYWKSVGMPGQGVFIGDPLAAPYLGYRLQVQPGSLLVHSSQLLRGQYRLLAADSAAGPFHDTGRKIAVEGVPQSFSLFPPYAAVYKLQRVDSAASAQPPKT